jgi:hypothetical protein
MKSTILKKFLAIVIAASLVASMAFSVSARQYTPYLGSKSGYTDSWYSEPVNSLTSNYTNIFPGEVGAIFFIDGVGFPSAFSRDTERVAQAYFIVNGQNVRYYEFKFRVYNGDYRIYTIPTTNRLEVANLTNLGTGKPAKFQLKWKVKSVAADMTRNLPIHVWIYQFWVD